jgi:hypothetical protein
MVVIAALSGWYRFSNPVHKKALYRALYRTCTGLHIFILLNVYRICTGFWHRGRQYLVPDTGVYMCPGIPVQKPVQPPLPAENWYRKPVQQVGGAIG